MLRVAPLVKRKHATDRFLHGCYSLNGSKTSLNPAIVFCRSFRGRISQQQKRTTNPVANYMPQKHASSLAPHVDKGKDTYECEGNVTMYKKVGARGPF